MPSERRAALCNPACTRVIKFMTDQEVPPETGLNMGPYSSVDGYRYVNLTVRFSQETAEEAPVDLGLVFAFDAAGTMGARCLVDLEDSTGSPQRTSFVEVSGEGTWHGTPHNISSYAARVPVMAPFVEVFVYNRAPITRTVSVWGYLVS